MDKHGTLSYSNKLFLHVVYVVCVVSVLKDDD